MHFSTWSARFFANPVDSFFPGVVAVMLSAFALARVSDRDAPIGWLMVVAIGVAGFVLSLGLQTPLYGWLYAVFPPMQGLRAAARFGNLFLLAIALLAGLGLAALRQTSPRGMAHAGRDCSRRARKPRGAARAVRVPALRRDPRVYDLLADETGPVVLAETPFYPPTRCSRTRSYVLNSTGHWRPLMNGYSGYTPSHIGDVAWTFWHFRRNTAIKAMRDAGVTHFTVHPHRFGNDAEKTIELPSGVRTSSCWRSTTRPGSGSIATSGFPERLAVLSPREHCAGWRRDERTNPALAAGRAAAPLRK